VDESNSLGGAISALINYQLPLTFICNGQQVPEDIMLARPNTLVKQASELLNEDELEQLDSHTLSSFGGFAAYG
jgi:flagellar biosynthesis protein FlhF